MIKILEIIGNKINLTKGDSANFNLSIYYPDMKNQYELMPGDKVIFSVSKSNSCNNKKILIKKFFENNEISLKPIDTAYLNCGNYEYDVQLVFKDGDVNTIIAPNLFQLSDEITPSILRNNYDFTPNNSVKQDVGQLIGVLNVGVKKVAYTDLNLEDLNNVEINSPQEGDLIFFSDNKWKNLDIEEVLKQETLILDGGHMN